MSWYPGVLGSPHGSGELIHTAAATPQIRTNPLSLTLTLTLALAQALTAGVSSGMTARTL